MSLGPRGETHLDATEEGLHPSGSGEPHDDGPIPGALPDRVGPYRVLEELGRGGMGIVYLAEQTDPVRRRVALKMVRQDVARKELRARFDAERRAMARLRHPYLAQMYDAGATDDGQPYFVMELVEGLPITEYCDSKQLTIHERIAIFRKVCEGVQHALEKGLLHRDLKPANILVTKADGRAVPKVLDFGVAKAIDQPLAEGTSSLDGRISGTPGYLAPEAVAAESRSDLDSRSDVYSLGIVLYQLLVGVRPFEIRGLSFARLLDLVQEKEPTSPSTRWTELESERRARLAESRGDDPDSLPRRLRGDLDWIVLKAIAKKREERYSSPAQLSADLGRHLRHQPVEASPTSTTYRLRKFVRRNRGMVTGAAAVVVSLLLGLTGTLVNLDRAHREAAATRQALAEVEEISDFLQGLFQVSTPSEARGNSITAREILDRGAESIRSGFEDQPLSRARLMLVMGKVYRELGLYDQAEPLLLETRNIREEELPTEDPEVAAARYELGWLFERQGRYEEAEALLRKALGVLEAALGSESADVADVLNALAGLYWDQGRYDEAEPLYLRSLEIRESVLGPDHSDVALSLVNLGALSWRLGRLDEAEAHYRRSIEIRERTFGPEDPRISQSLNGLGAVLWTQKRFEETEAVWRRAVAISEKTLGPDHPELARIVHNLGVLNETQGRLEEAETLYLRAQEIRQKALGPDHPGLGIGLKNLGTLYRKLERFEEAESHFLRALELYEAGLEPDEPRILSALKDLAGLYRDLGRLSEAEPLYRRALAGLEAGLPANREKLKDTWSGYAQLLRASGREAEAREAEARSDALAADPP